MESAQVRLSPALIAALGDVRSAHPTSTSALDVPAHQSLTASFFTPSIPVKRSLTTLRKGLESLLHSAPLSSRAEQRRGPRFGDPDDGALKLSREQAVGCEPSLGHRTPARGDSRRLRRAVHLSCSEISVLPAMYQQTRQGFRSRVRSAYQCVRHPRPVPMGLPRQRG